MKIKNAWCAGNNGFPVLDSQVQRYISVVPSQRQLEYSRMKYYNFLHFGVNTFTDREWGDGSESESVFAPSGLDTDQWCRVLKNSGSSGVILTAKHHDGFCLFDTRYTDHNVMNSPFGKDVAALLRRSCEKYSLKLGMYLSPWDRHEKTYGTQEYNDFFVNQLTELCTNYGELFCVWFDGACGEGKNGKKQSYDWGRYYEVVRKYQPNAVIAVCGPDVRWIGNEGGKVRKAEWSVVPFSDKTVEQVIKNSQNTADSPPTGFDQRSQDIGSREKLSDKGELCFSPAEADVSINHGWFWHDEKYYLKKLKKPVRSARELSKIYFNTVGANASMLLNVPPDRRGLINEREIKILERFAGTIKDAFAVKVPCKMSVLTVGGAHTREISCPVALKDGQAGLSLNPAGKFRTLYIQEDISFSQRVEEFKVYADGVRIYKGTVIGSGRIIRLPCKIKAREISLVITQSRGEPIIKSIEIFG